MEKKSLQKMKGEHCLNLFISFELKAKLKEFAQHYERPTADIVRTLLRMGIPIMEGFAEAEKKMIREYPRLIRKLHISKSLVDL